MKCGRHPERNEGLLRINSMDFTDIQEDLDQACVAAGSIPRSWARATPGQQLRALRLSRNVSQRHLADESGVDQADISRLEQGADARWSTWQRLYTALGFEVVLAPLPSSEDAEDLIQDENLRRLDRMEAGRNARW